MPTRSRASNARAAAQPDLEEGSYSIEGLNFREPLSWRAGKAIAVADLITRLQKLAKELRDVEQGAIEVQDITKLAHDLVHANLLGHKDKGIRAWTVSCIVDILNICAPNAPYKSQQLKDIFTVIIHTILPALADPTNPYNTQHQYILDQLVDAQSIVLITDLQDAESLLSQLFTVCFDVVSGSAKNASGVELGQTVIFQITTLLNTVVDEANLPQEVVDIIISQFFRVDPKTIEQPPLKKRKGGELKDKSQSTLLLKDYPPAYHLAKSVCTACSDKMSPAISQYFSTIITNASAALDDDEGGKTKVVRRSSPDSGDEEDYESLNDLKKVHCLGRELWRACPDVLMNVISQLEVELAADAVSLRQLAVETIGDLTAGIGLVGLPELNLLDPAAFPLPTIETSDVTVLSTNPLLRPSAAKPFAHMHASTYQAFLRRHLDKAASVRVAWTVAAGRILLTNAGGIGLNEEELGNLVSAYAQSLRDGDEKVRLSALQSLQYFPYHTFVELLGSDGGLSEPKSLLSAVAERVIDKKIQVREQAMILLARAWGVGSRDIANNNEKIRRILGPAPARLLSAMYVNDQHIVGMLPKILYEDLLPLNWPPIKGKMTMSETQGDGDVTESSVDPDSVRVKRMLSLVRDLDERSKPVFYKLQKRQAELARGITTFLQACEDYNGGVLDDSKKEKSLEQHLNRLIESLSKTFSDPSKGSSDLWKFAKAHDRRSYQLIKFAMGAEYDFKTMTKAIKELSKRIRDNVAGMGSILDTMMTLMYQCALITYNRSNIPAIMESTRSSDTTFAETAQEVLREISEKVPEVMKTHIQVLCKELEDDSPSDGIAESPSSVDSLKACSAFAKKFPDEIPKDRKFIAALQNFAQYSNSPKVAKYAVSIVLTSSDKRELRAKEFMTKALQLHSKGAKNTVAQLATIAQVCLLAPSLSKVQQKEVATVAQKILEAQSGAKGKQSYDPNAWSDAVDSETASKQMALKIFVNICRAQNSQDATDTFISSATSAIESLAALIKNDGQIVTGGNTPSVQRNQLRLTAARYLLKLCRHQQRCEELIKPKLFQEVCWILVSPPHGVRAGFITQVKKYVSLNAVNSRWITPLFLLPFEPDNELKISTMAWLKSRAVFYAHRQKQARLSSTGDKKAGASNIMELTFARLLSLLAHHPDFPVKGEARYDGDLLDFAKYIIFYLQCVASEDNLSLIFHVAQRVKQASDAVSKSEETDTRLYILSDLAQATIRNYADQMPGGSKGMNLLQTWPGKANMPATLFQPINGHTRATEIAATNYLPEDVALGLEDLVRKTLRINRQGFPSRSKARTTERKRKSSVSIDLEADEAEEVRKSAKKSKGTTLPIRRTPNPKKRKSEHLMSVEQPSRKSARSATAKKVSYEESDEEGDENDDPESVIKYKPATMESHRGKRTKKSPANELEEEEIVEDAKDQDALSDAGPEDASSPTPGGNEDIHESDVEMANGHGEDVVADDKEVDVAPDDATDDEKAKQSSKSRAKRTTRHAKITTTPKVEKISKADSTSKKETPAKKSKASTTSSKDKPRPEEVHAPSSPPVDAGPWRRSQRMKG